MRLLARLRLCYAILRAQKARDWRRITATCEEVRSQATFSEIMASVHQEEALHTELAQVAAGVRTTRQAARLLAEARHLLAPKA